MNRDEAWTMMMAIATIEQHCIDLRKLMCDGSLLHGHTVKQEITPQMVEQAWRIMDVFSESFDRALAAMGQRPS